MASAPAGIAKDIDVGRPVRQPEVVILAFSFREHGVVLGAGFVGDDGRDFLQERFVPHGS